MQLPAFPSQNLASRAVISLTGENLIGFLNNILTCELEGLHKGEARYGALLSPQGKIQHDMFVFRDKERVLLDCAASQVAALVKRLSLYKLRAKLVIAVESEIEVGVHLEKPEGVLTYLDPRNADLGWRSFAPAGTFINVPSTRGYHERRIRLGLADSNDDIGEDKIFPHEANLDQLGGVSFTKGCYVGQEVVSRMQHRGTARNRFLPVITEAETVNGEQVTSDGALIGEIHSHSGLFALALLRIDRLAEAKGRLMAGSTYARVMKPAWVTYPVAIPEIAQ